MSSVYALLAALAFGVGDFLGGLASRTGHWSLVAATAQAAGLTLLITLALIGGGELTGVDIGWSIAAGLSFGAGVTLLYRALAEGRMSVVAPITALCAIVLPSAYPMYNDQLPTVLAMLGIVVSIPALTLISRESTNQIPRSHPPLDQGSVVTAIVAGIGIAAFYICLKQTTPTGGLWPVVIARIASTGLCGGFVILWRRNGPARNIARQTLRLALAAGILDGAANALLLIAVRKGDLAIVATLSSLYPAVTILFAWIILKERINRMQAIGLCLAGMAASAIATAP